jgi:hypothetical protein
MEDESQPIAMTATKRRRVELEQMSDQGHYHHHHSVPCFLPFHLELLEFLCKDDKVDQKVTNDECSGAAPTDNDGGDHNDTLKGSMVFSAARDFLKERSKLVATKQETARYQGIRREAQIYKDNHIMRVQTAASHALHNNNNSFGVIWNLLEVQSQKATHDFDQQTLPFLPLLQSTRRRIQTLQRQVNQEQATADATTRRLLDELLSSNPKESASKSASAATTSLMGNMDERSRMMTTFCKLRLWKLLAHDLESILVLNS